MTIDRAITEISSFLGDRLTCSKSELSQHGHSESYFPNMPPDAVAYPETTAEVSRIVQACAANGCPVVAWGTGTSLEGHAIAPRGGISVDFRRMNKVLAVNPEDRDVVVQPGLTREELNTELRATGLFFPVDPGANASLGGMAATRASGTTTVRYGSMRENVIGLEVVLADGQVIRTGSRAAKSSSGYDLTRLMVGSEGTLGLITELTLRLHGQPEAISAAVVPFASFHGAVQTVIETIQMGIPMARIEFVDAEVAQMFNTHNAAGLPEVPHLLVEFHGSESGVAESVARFGEIASDNGGGEMRWADKAEDRTALWKMRHDLAHTIMASYPGKRFIFTDVCVPISRLAEAVEETRDDIEASGMSGPIAGHVGDGNFHAALVVDPDRPDTMARGKDLSHRMVKRALHMGGTVSGEHGIGMGKLDYMNEEHGAAWPLMARIKRALDPDEILNPGKMVRQNG